MEGSLHRGLGEREPGEPLGWGCGGGGREMEGSPLKRTR